MIYEINGLQVDKYGEVSAPWAEDKISIFDLLNRYTIGDDLFIVIYRNGKRIDTKTKIERGAILPVRIIYPQYEKVDYEVIGGMVVMQLTMNHVNVLIEQNPLFYKYIKI